MGRFPALAHLQFRRYFIGQAIALVGGFAHGMAMAWLGYRLTGSVAVLGLIGFASLAPALVVSPFAGLLADRYPRRTMLIALLSLVAVLGLLLAGLTAMGWVSTGVLIAIAVLRGTAFAMEIPIRSAFLVDLISDRAVLPNAVALHSTALNTARFLGPALGGVLIARFGEAACFLLHPLLLLATLVQLWRIEAKTTSHAKPGGSYLSQFLEGWRFAFADKVIARMLVGVFILGFAIGPYTHLMPAAVAQLFGAHPELVGLFLASAGVGAMVSSISMAARRSSRNLPVIALAGNVSAAVGLLLFSLSHWLAASVLGMVLVGMGVIIQALCTNTSIQQRVDDDKRGRVLALYTAMFVGSTPLGSLLAGQWGLVVGAAGTLTTGALIGLAGAFLTAWRMRK